ncbi:MAG: hypothetical protein WA581_19975 [Candidatus Acidiferrales bacterium]
MSHTPLRFTNVRTLLLVSAGLLCFSTPAHPQSSSTQNPQPTSDQSAQSNRYAQNNEPARDNDGPSRGVVQFDRFLDSHPDISAQVRKNPTLLVNYDFLQSHPELNAFLKARPQLNAEISRNSVAFMQLENRLEQPDGRRDLAELDRFMNSHPDVAAQLRQKPWLVTNDEFLQSHPDLNTFLQDHPQLRTEIGQNPVAFMQEENSFAQPDRTRDAANFNRFLDTHREVGEQVRKNPYLVNDRTFVKNHPDLQAYFQQNPGIRDELNRNPNAFAPHEQPVNYREYQNNPDPRDLAQFARFMDSHREIAEQLRKDPSLLDNRQFIQNHPELQNFLRANPGVRDQLSQDPNAFVQREEQFNRSQNVQDRDNRRDLAQFDRFLDSHREIAEQVRKNPSLANNREFVENHPALQDYLRDNPGVRDEIRQDPNTFMHQEDRFDASQHWGDRDAAHQHMASFGEFLESHQNIRADVTKDPSMLKNREYVQNHPELDGYLSAHPEMRDEMMADPDGFVKGAQQFKSSISVGASTNGSGSGTSTGTGTTTQGTKPKQ